MSSLLKSTLNTRALPTGSLRFIRSDCPANLSDEEIWWLRQNDITVIVDLREQTEIDRKHCRLEAEEGFVYLNLPVTGGGEPPKSPEDVAESYLRMLDGQMERIIDTILNAKHNVLFFCGAGKDRTGVVSAVLLKKLGFDDETILDDYMKTKENLTDFLTDYVKQHPEVDLQTILPNERNIREVLNTLKKKKEVT